MRIKIVDLYIYSKSQSLPLLGRNNYDFWQPYLNSYNVFDRYFRDRFKNWRYFETFAQGIGVSDLYTDFVEAIGAFLAINSKRYSELYRVQVLPDSAYDIVNNYDLTETHTNTRSESGTDVEGAREDRTSGSTTEGEREDSTSGNTTDGARTDSGSTVAGAQKTTTTGSIQGFNSSSFSDADKQVAASDGYTDTTSVSKGEQRNSSSTSSTKGEQVNSSISTLNKGSQSNTHNLTGSENINIRRYGNIGVQTPADVIGGHITLWERLFNFYKMIFDEIAKDYLLMDDDYTIESSYSGGGSGGSDAQVLAAIAALSARVNAGFEAGAKSSQVTGLATSSQVNNATSAIRGDIADLNNNVEALEVTTGSIALDVDALQNTANSIALDVDALQSTTNSIALDVSALRSSSLAYKNEIVGSIEGVSTDEY